MSNTLKNETPVLWGEPGVRKNTRQESVAQADQPPCYGQGWRWLDEARKHCGWRRVLPAECFRCPHERRCLAQQRHMRRLGAFVPRY